MYVMLAYFGGFPLLYYLKALTETEDTRRIEGLKQLFICTYVHLILNIIPFL